MADLVDLEDESSIGFIDIILCDRSFGHLVISEVKSAVVNIVTVGANSRLISG
jgi:hypothetical protein